MNDHELEQHITDLGLLIQKAYADGDRAAARAWAATRAEAIKSRSTAQIEAMETERGLGPCQFITMADETRAAAGASR